MSFQDDMDTISFYCDCPHETHANVCIYQLTLAVFLSFYFLSGCLCVGSSCGDPQVCGGGVVVVGVV